MEKTQQEKIKEIHLLMDAILGDRCGNQYLHGDGRWIEIRQKIGEILN